MFGCGFVRCSMLFLVVKLPSPTPTTLTDTSASVLNSVQQDLANRRTKQGISRQDSRLSVKSLIESIENATKQAKAGKWPKIKEKNLDWLEKI